MANLPLRSVRSEHLRNRLGQCSGVTPEGGVGSCSRDSRRLSVALAAARRCVTPRCSVDNVSFVPPDPPLSDGVITLRPLDESDLPTIERAASDAEILKWFDLHTRSPAAYLAAKREAWAEGTGASFAICDATRPDTCLGQVFIERDDDGRGSVGYWLLEDSRGKGRATRAVRLMASWALPEMRLGRLQLQTDPDNVASQRVAERAGFTREGVFRAYNGRRDGTRADAYVYSLLPHLEPTPFANSS
jgi:RimJ/RimL family protein N-acetyltransferase